MKTSVGLFLIAVLFTLTFIACQKESADVAELSTEEVAKSYANVPAALWPYFQRFEEEAQLRGETIDLSTKNITAEIMEISESGVVGTCSFSSHEPNHIVIDQSFFNQTGDLFKEMVVFHELGHCVLFRGHREDVYADGTCVSIMRSGLEGCHDNYRNHTRDTYLDELFDPMN